MNKEGPRLGFEPRQKAPQASRLPSYLTSATFPYFSVISAALAWLCYIHCKRLIFVCGRFFCYRHSLRLRSQSSARTKNLNPALQKEYLQIDMISKAEVATSVCRYLPQCPLCGASKGYAISGISKTYAQCIGCGAKWMSSDFPKFKEINEMALYECADDGRGISLESIRMRPISFWRDWAFIQKVLEDERIRGVQTSKEKRARQRFERSFMEHHTKIVNFSG